jgi:hypothetical protein
MRRLWVVLVTEGRRVRFAPEVYPTELRAERESYRWGWFLAGGEESKIQTVDEHHWRVGRTRVHLVPAQVREIPLASELWVGVCWGPDGQIVATGVLLDKYKAMAWLRSIPSDPNIKPGTKDHTMYLSRTVTRYDGELTGLAYRAKVGASFDSAIADSLPEIPEAVDYEIDLTATFSHVIHTTIRAEPGLTAEGVSERVDREFPNLAAYQGQLVDAAWELEEFKQIGGQRPKPAAGSDQPSG